MLVDKYRLLSSVAFAPETGVGSGTDDGGTPLPAGGDQGGDAGQEDTGPGSGRSELRGQLEKNFEVDRKKGAQTEKKYVSRARQEQKEQGEEEGTEEGADTAAAEGADQGQQSGQPATAAPEGWSKEAKAEWAKVPPTVQAAILKREQDTAKGVQEIQAKYRDLDSVLAPRTQQIRSFGKTPAQTVDQMFSWFDALTSNPDMTFPALMQSFKYDARRLIPVINQILAQQGAQQGQQGAQQGQQQEQGGDVPEGVKAYVSRLEQQVAQLGQAFQQKIGSLENNFQQANYNKTLEVMNNWARGKPYFEDVRMMMGRLLESGQVEALPNGEADLDKAYDMALWALPEIRTKVMGDIEAKKEAERKAKTEAERKAQQDQVAKARRASASLAPSAPGSPGTPGQPRKGQRQSIRDSLKAAINEVNG